jgi:hypothetical protein
LHPTSWIGTLLADEFLDFVLELANALFELCQAIAEVVVVRSG